MNSIRIPLLLRLAPQPLRVLNCDRLLRRSSFLIPFLFFVAIAPAVADVNSWIKPSNGNWEEQSSWSLGVLPNATQDIVFTNAGFKAIAISTNATHNFPSSMAVQSVLTSGPTNSFNVLLLNFAGFELPLQTTDLTVQANSAIYVLSSALEVQNLASITGTFVQGDFSPVHFGTLRVYAPGNYFMTNGPLSISFLQTGFGGQFVQYGGTNHVGVRTEIFDTGTYQLNGGQFSSSSLLSAEDGVLLQNGGVLIAPVDVGGDFGPGHYILNGGTVTGNMSVPSARGRGDVLQNGGTNAATSLSIGNGSRFGGEGDYTLSNGVITVSSSTVLRGYGSFAQWNGQHIIATNLALQGSDLAQFGVANASYTLNGGTLSAQNLTMGIASFTQSGGSNFISGDITIGPAGKTSRYTLSGGFLSASNLTLNGALSSVALTDGTLVVTNISISNSAVFHHIGGTINHSGLVTLAGGTWEAGSAEQILGPLLLTGPPTNSAITFSNGPSILRFANSSTQPWNSTATLYINNWHGSGLGGGATQLYFGSNANGVTPQQLALVKFTFSGAISSAKILATGEVVPQAQLLTSSRSGNTLTLNWDVGWFLQSSTNVAGPYQDLQEAVSPYTVSMDEPIQFFRLRQ